MTVFWAILYSLTQTEEDVDVYFRDNARNIAGKVKIWGLEMDSNRNIGKAVLREYDAGRYTLI